MECECLDSFGALQHQPLLVVLLLSLNDPSPSSPHSIPPAWYKQPGLTPALMHQGILLRCAQQQYNMSASPSSSSSAAASSPDGSSSSGSSSNTNGSSNGNGYGPQQLQPAAPAARRRPRLQTELPALVVLIKRANEGWHVPLVADALRAVRVALARQGLLAPFGAEVVSAFVEVGGRGSCGFPG
jgi:hypothetical protein